MLLRIGTRGSALARAQTSLIAEALRLVHPDLQIETCEITTFGDQTQHTNRPSEQWGQGVFVKELEQALLQGEVDLAVHSLKDVPPVIAEGLTLAAIPAREDPRDVLVTPDGRGFEDLPAQARVGTSSARRVALLRDARHDLEYLPIRGNVDTRYRKLTAGEYDAIVLARAGLARLALQVPFVPFDPDVLLPAPGQGALALQTRADDTATLDLVRPLHDAATGAAVAAERWLMERLDGGCRLPVAALATVSGDQLELRAAVAAANGSRVLRGLDSGAMADPGALADRLADRLLAEGAADLLASVEAAA